MFKRLTPVLPVRDVLAERDFYESLGFERYVDPQESYPESVFAALSSSKEGKDVLFGVAIAPDFDPDTAEQLLWWQIEVSDVKALYERAKLAGLEIESPPKLESWGRRTMKLRSPNGYVVSFEEVSG
jgi:uncharacterized glyoxalase superfamily protein PhnB